MVFTLFQLGLFVVGLATFLAATVAGAADQTGEQIYQSLCQSCHGLQGAGTAEHKKPLIGDLSILELARVIDKTMPEGEPEQCSAEESRKVAEYIHGAFYSPTAQERIRPARIELARLTNRQYQNSVADLVAAMNRDTPPAWGTERGLRGQYYKSRRIDRRSVAIERVDPAVQFDFGVGSPDPALDAHEFSIRWDGSLLAPDTGDYEFIVRTEHACQLWVNDDDAPLINAWVKSGSDVEFRGSRRLLGGRMYALRLEYSKAKQGVRDNKAKDQPPAKSSISLAWKPPRRTEEIIPARCLSPKTTPRVFVVNTHFPPDDRSVGYERGSSVSKAWDQATTAAAIEVADDLAARRDRLVGASDRAADYDAKLKAFCNRFVERAFRRPLTPEQQSQYLDRHFVEGVQPEAAIKRVVLLTLKSPRFLFREVGGTKGNAFDVAARLSFELWDSLPDEPLLQAAANGRLATREQVLSQAHRMLADQRAQSKLHAFFQQWLKLDQIGEVTKDREQYPRFTKEVANDLRTSLELFVDEIVFSDASDFRRLLTANELPLNDRLLDFYDVDPPADALLRNVEFRPVALDPAERSGVLTHPFLLASFAYQAGTSPIHRGVWIWRSLFGRSLKVPPEAVAPLSPELKPDLTTRERVALQTQSEACMTCHTAINPLGFTLEDFDAVGRFRTHEKGKPIDDTGRYITRDGEEVHFDGARPLAAYLATSDESHAAFVEQLFQYIVKQPIRAFGPDQLTKLKTSFREHDYHIRNLAAEIAASAALP